MQDFPQPCAGEHEQAQRRRGVRIDLGKTVLWFNEMPGIRPALVDLPGNARGLRLADRRPDSLQLLGGKKTLSSLLWIPGDLANGIGTLGQDADASGKAHHAREHGHRAVGMGRRRLELPVKLGDRGAGELVGFRRANLRLHDRSNDDGV
jgi:hypothetical protein